MYKIGGLRRVKKFKKLRLCWNYKPHVRDGGMSTLWEVSLGPSLPSGHLVKLTWDCTSLLGSLSHFQHWLSTFWNHSKAGKPTAPQPEVRGPWSTQVKRETGVRWERPSLGGNTLESKGREKKDLQHNIVSYFPWPILSIEIIFQLWREISIKDMRFMSRRLGSKLEELLMVKGWDNSSIKKGKNCSGLKDKCG